MNADLSILTRLLTPAETAALPLGTISGRWRIAYSDGRIETYMRFVIPVQD